MSSDVFFGLLLLFSPPPGAHFADSVTGPLAGEPVPVSRQSIDLQSLESKRLQLDLIYTYKILTVKIDIKYYIYFHPTVIPVHAGPWL